MADFMSWNKAYCFFSVSTILLHPGTELNYGATSTGICESLSAETLTRFDWGFNNEATSGDSFLRSLKYTSGMRRVGDLLLGSYHLTPLAQRLRRPLTTSSSRPILASTKLTLLNLEFRNASWSESIYSLLLYSSISTATERQARHGGSSLGSRWTERQSQNCRSLIPA